MNNVVWVFYNVFIMSSGQRGDCDKYKGIAIVSNIKKRGMF